MKGRDNILTDSLLRLKTLDRYEGYDPEELESEYANLFLYRFRNSMLNQ